ncbi:MAG: penicillin-binding protein 2, partial [Kiritimatiellae bacterium]|nr:penicillin-binding protein 2 [Kiritimatiellia bacterium]
MTDQRTKWRFVISMIALILAMACLGTRLAFLHLGLKEKMREGFEKSRSLEKNIHPGRGIICDCKGEGNILAINLFVKDVCADPSVVLKSNMLVRVASLLSEKLDLPVDEVAVRLNQPDKRFAYIKRLVKQETVTELEKHKLAGIFLQDTTARYYPHGSFMCHILGFVNYDGVGSAGVEQGMDKYLKGSPGSLETLVDARRQELYDQRFRYIPPLEGANVVLTVDQNLQYIVEKALDEAMVEHHAKGAWVIVERVRTGEILAMASRPAYDLNEFTSADDNVKLNRAIGMVYEPGSTFKPVTISAALNEGTVSPENVFDCENGAWMYKNRVLKDYHPYGNLTVADGVKKSSNILTAKVALTLGEKRMRQYLCAFGIGSKTGLDMPGEETGILRPLSGWSGISATRIAIGQGVAVTALQMVNMISAIANDGYLMRPYIVSQVLRSNGTVLINTKPEVLSRPISSETAAIMRKLLLRVTEDGGTGRKARVEGYEVAGKTGTAQKPVDGGYSSTAYTASFLGFLPADDPEIAMVTVIDEPQPIHLGGTVAAPIFSKLAHQPVRCLDIP